MGELTMIAVAQESANAKLVTTAPEVDFARAQLGERMRRTSVLTSLAADDPDA